MKKLVKAAHVLFACLWLGASASVVVLQCLRGWSDNSLQLANLNWDLGLLDFMLIIPGAAGSLVTGFLICKTTSWRFFRYRWVIAKWICGVTGILVGGLLLGPWQIELVNLSGELNNSPTAGSPYDLIRLPFTVIGFLQVYLLIVMVAISILKPWGKRLTRQVEPKPMGVTDRTSRWQPSAAKPGSSAQEV